MNPLTLSPSQQRAVASHGPTLVTGGPGTGKTAVLLMRAQRALDEGADPRSVQILAFNRDARQSNGARLAELVGQEAAERVGNATFHQLGLQLLRAYGDQLGYPSGQRLRPCPEETQERLFGQAVLSATKALEASAPALARRLSIQSEEECAALRRLISIEKAKGRFADDVQATATSEGDQILAAVYTAYQSELKRAGTVDFDDLILECVRLLTEVPVAAAYVADRFTHVLCDEAQDLSPAMYRLFVCIARHTAAPYLSGDPFQAIYAWRAALGDEVFSRFKTDFEGVESHQLVENNRSQAYIVALANRLRGDAAGDQVALQPTGALIHLVRAGTEFGELYTVVETIRQGATDGRVRLSDIAIICRSHELVMQVEAELLGVTRQTPPIPYRVIGRADFMKRKEIRLVISALRLTQDPGDTGALKDLLPLFGLSAKHQALVKGDAPEIRLDMLEDIDRIFSLAGERAAQGALQALDGVQALGRLKQDPPAAVIDWLLSDAGGLTAHLLAEAEEGPARLKRVQELRRFAARLPTIQALLDEVDLAGGDDPFAGEQDQVSVLTAHCSKGLEFPVVFVIGLDTGTPAYRPQPNPSRALAETQLLYVQVTRARQLLTLSYATRRGGQDVQPAALLRGLPRELFARTHPQL